MVLSPAELEFRESVERYTRTDWAREQQKEPVCGATIRYVLLNHPSSVPKDFFVNVSYHHRHKPSLEDYRELTDKGRLVTDDGICRLVRKPTKTPVSSDRPGGRAARLLNDEPTRIYVRMLMRPWVMQACHANALCHLGTARTISLLEVLLVDWDEYQYSLVDSAMFEMSGRQNCASDYSLADSDDPSTFCARDCD